MRLASRLLVSVMIAVGIQAAGLQALPVHAATQTLTVSDCTNETGTNTLGAAITTANGDTNDTINFSCSGTITFTAPLTLSSSMTIDAAGQTVAISGGNTSQIFSVNSGTTVSLKDLTVEDGSASCSQATYGECQVDGGAIDNNGSLSISDSTLSGNSPTCTVSAMNATCSVDGGAIANNGTLNIANSTFSGNAPTCTATGTFTGCSVAGGAIANNESDTLTITNSTFAGNSPYCSATGDYSSCSVDGAALFTISVYSTSGTLTITNSTVAGNSPNCSLSQSANYCATGGTIFVEGPFYFGADIFANNSNGNCDVYGGYDQVVDWGYNFDDDDTCLNGGTDDINEADPKLDSNGL